MKQLIKHSMKKISLVLVASSLAFSVWAMSLEQAKKQGLVGELPNGYLGAVVSNNDVNSI